MPPLPPPRATDSAHPRVRDRNGLGRITHVEADPSWMGEWFSARALESTTFQGKSVRFLLAQELLLFRIEGEVPAAPVLF